MVNARSRWPHGGRILRIHSCGIVEIQVDEVRNEATVDLLNFDPYRGGLSSVIPGIYFIIQQRAVVIDKTNIRSIRFDFRKVDVRRCQ